MVKFLNIEIREHFITNSLISCGFIANPEFIERYISPANKETKD